MLIRSAEARSSRSDSHLAWSLAGIAGALNTAGFYAAGLFSSNMSGNVSALADHTALADLGVAAIYLALVVTFIAGAASSALLINAGRRRNFPGIYALSILAEGILLAVLAGADMWLSGSTRGHLLAFGLSFLMGLQNAVVTRISSARVRTTHVTGMITDIGIELGNLIDLSFLHDHPERADFNKEKLLLHGFTVSSFLAGGIVGVLAYKAWGAYFLLAIAAILLAMAAFSMIRSGKQRWADPKQSSDTTRRASLVVATPDDSKPG